MHNKFKSKIVSKNHLYSPTPQPSNIQSSAGCRRHQLRSTKGQTQSQCTSWAIDRTSITDLIVGKVSNTSGSDVIGVFMLKYVKNKNKRQQSVSFALCFGSKKVNSISALKLQISKLSNIFIQLNDLQSIEPSIETQFSPRKSEEGKKRSCSSL